MRSTINRDLFTDALNRLDIFQNWRDYGQVCEFGMVLMQQQGLRFYRPNNASDSAC